MIFALFHSVDHVVIHTCIFNIDCSPIYATLADRSKVNLDLMCLSITIVLLD